MYQNIIYTILILGINIPLSPLFAPQWIQDKDESGRVKIVSELLDQKLFRIFLLDSFENTNNWQIYRSASHLNHVDLIPITPNKTSFQEETAVIQKYIQSDTSTSSLMIQSYLELPGKQHLEIRPDHTIEIPDGLPLKLILWVYAQNYDIRMKFLFQQKHTKDLSLDAGMLDFDGWKRIETDFILPEKNKKLMESLHNPLQLKSIIFQSGPRQKKGEFFIYLDRMYFIIDEKKMIYPGSDIRDNWNKNY